VLRVPEILAPLLPKTMTLRVPDILAVLSQARRVRLAVFTSDMKALLIPRIAHTKPPTFRVRTLRARWLELEIQQRAFVEAVTTDHLTRTESADIPSDAFGPPIAHVTTAVRS
jgi:hypothetical protein